MVLVISQFALRLIPRPSQALLCIVRVNQKEEGAGIWRVEGGRNEGSLGILSPLMSQVATSAVFPAHKQSLLLWSQLSTGRLTWTQLSPGCPSLWDLALPPPAFYPFLQ